MNMIGQSLKTLYCDCNDNKPQVPQTVRDQMDPVPLPTYEEKQRGPKQSDTSHDFWNYGGGRTQRSDRDILALKDARRAGA